MLRECSPNILKTILSLVKKSSAIINVEQLELLNYHDWKKCRSLLHEFIQTSKLSLPALEYVKNLGIISTGNGKRMGADQNHTAPAHLTNNSMTLANPLKQFYSSISGLVPKMSNPDLNSRKMAAKTML